MEEGRLVPLSLFPLPPSPSPESQLLQLPLSSCCERCGPSISVVHQFHFVSHSDCDTRASALVIYLFLLYICIRDHHYQRYQVRKLVFLLRSLAYAPGHTVYSLIHLYRHIHTHSLSPLYSSHHDYCFPLSEHIY